MVTVALDIDPAHAYPWIDAVSPTSADVAHPQLIDTQHITDEMFGFTNIPMAVWIDEHGTIVRPAESASIERSPLRDMEIPEGLDERLTRLLTEAKNIPDISSDYRAAVVDWAQNGSSSRFVLAEDEVIVRSQPRGESEARAAACFELGEYLRRTIGGEAGEQAAVPWWREAHRLYPSNWTYKRQAWTLVTTPTGSTANDLIQGPNDVYEGNWLDDVIAGGGGDAYIVKPRF